MRKPLLILLAVLILVAGFIIYQFSTSPNSSPELNPIDTSHVQQPIIATTPLETSTLKPYIVKELSKTKSSSDIEQINHFNNQIDDPALSLDVRKRAVDRVVELASEESIPILLDSVKVLESDLSASSESKDVKTYCLLQVSKAYEKQTNKFLSAKQPLTNDPQPTSNATSNSSQITSSSPQSATPAPSNVNPGSTPAQDPNAIPSASANDVVPLPYSTDPVQLILKKSLDDVTKIDVADKNGFVMLSDVLLDVQKPQAVKLLAMKKACEFDKTKAIALLGQVIDLESEENDDVVKVTAVKALFDMNLPESDKTLDDIQGSSKNKKVVEAIIYLKKENK